MLSLDCSAVFSGGTGGARAPLEFGESEKGQSLISTYRSLAINTNTPSFKKLYTALDCVKSIEAIGTPSRPMLRALTA